MTKLISLHIENFRGIKNLECNFSESNICCIIGHCDSGKSTILQAISYLFSTNWTIPITDEDFYNLNVNNSIKISGVVQDPPEQLITDDKYGYDLFFRDEEKQEGKCLEITLTVDDDLNPRWEIHNHNNDEFHSISNKDRYSFNISTIDDYFDTQFNMSKYSMLKSLIADVKGDKKLDSKIGIDLIRDLKKHLNICEDVKDKLSSKLNEQVALLGGEQREYSLAVPTTELFLKGSQICLHSGNIPVNLLGKGSRRQLSLGLQLTLENSKSSIILIDEIEQGLEPYKIKTIVRTLKDSNRQVFLTTHSATTLCELDANDLYLLKTGVDNLIHLDKNYQALLRTNQDAFFFDKLIVCEGETEYGFILEFDRFVWRQDKKTISSCTISPIIGKGNNITNVIKNLNQLSVSTLCFMDGDKSDIIQELEGKTKICRCEDDLTIEKQFFKDAPKASIDKIIDYLKKRTLIKSDYVFDDDKRDELGDKSVTGKWFKSVRGGRLLGEVLFDHLNDLNANSTLYKQIQTLVSWINDDK